MKTALLVLSGLLVSSAPRAWAQTEDDHATRTSGHDPAAENRPDLQAQNLEGDEVPFDIDKTFGFGYGQTPGGLRGLQAEYYLSPQLMLNAHLALGLFSPETGDSAFAFGIAGGAFYRWKVWDRVALMLGGRLAIGHADGGGSGELGKVPQVYPGTGSATQFNIEAVMRVQLYLGILALQAEVGPVIAVLGDGGGVLGDWRGRSQGFYIDLPNHNLIYSIGAVIYTN